MIGQITEDTDELGGVFTRWVIGNILVLVMAMVMDAEDTDELAGVLTRWIINVELVFILVLMLILVLLIVIQFYFGTLNIIEKFDCME